MDSSCTGVIVETDSTDPSGFFVKRFFGDADGLPPYDSEATGSLGGFRLTLADAPPSPPPAAAPVAKRKKCKKKKHKRSAESARKKKCENKKKR